MTMIDVYTGITNAIPKLGAHTFQLLNTELDSPNAPVLVINDVDVTQYIEMSLADKDEYTNKRTVVVSIGAVGGYKTIYSNDCDELDYDRIARQLIVAAHDVKRKTASRNFRSESIAKISHEVRHLGGTAELKPDNAGHETFYVDGVSMAYLVDYDHQHQRIIVGHYGESKRFPKRQNGTYNWPKIADALRTVAALAKRQLQKREAEENMAQIRQDNGPGVTKLQEELGLREYTGNMRVEPSSSAELPVFVTVKIERAMKYSDAVMLHEMLKELGYI